MKESEYRLVRLGQRTGRGGTRGAWSWAGFAAASLLLTACSAVASPGEHNREAVKLSVLTPDAGWEFRVREVRETDEDVWIWAELERRPGPAAQQLTTLTATAEVPAGKPRTVFVTGKTWRWENEEPYRFVKRLPPWPEGSRVVQQPGERPGA